MLPQKWRLKSRQEVNIVFQNGKTVKSDFLLLRYRKNNLSHSRIAFSVGLKYSKSAVQRNYMKRVLREAVRSFLPQVKPGYDLVFFLSATASSKKKHLNLKTIVLKIQQLLSSANLIIK